MTSSSEDITVSKNSAEGEKGNQLPILSSITEGEQMDEQELNFSGNEDEDEAKNPMGTSMLRQEIW